MRQVADVDQLESEALGHLADRAVGERARRVPDRPELLLGELLDLGQVVVAGAHEGAQFGVRAARLLGGGDRLARAAGELAVQPDERAQRVVGHRTCPARTRGRPSSAYTGLGLGAIELDLERRPARWVAAVSSRSATGMPSRSAMAPSSDRRGSRLPFSISESWLGGDADLGAELVEGEAGLGAEVPHPLSEGRKIVHILRIRKESAVLSPLNSGFGAEFRASEWKSMTDSCPRLTGWTTLMTLHPRTTTPSDDST